MDTPICKISSRKSCASSSSGPKTAKSVSSTAQKASSSTSPADYYTVLGVEKNASKSEIKKAYGQLAWKWHPQKNLAHQQEAIDMFKKISEAYAILSDAVIRRHYDSYLSGDNPLFMQSLQFADPYYIFNDFKSFKGMKVGDDEDDIDISSASEDEEDDMSIASGDDFSSAQDSGQNNLQIVSFEYSVTKNTINDDMDVVGDTSTLPAFGSTPGVEPSSVSVVSSASSDDDRGKDVDEVPTTKSVHLLTEIRPNGRTYMTKKLSENGVETLNVVREGDITDADIAEAEKFVES